MRWRGVRRVRRDDWLTDVAVRYLAFRDVDGMRHLLRRESGRQRRARVLRLFRGWR